MTMDVAAIQRFAISLILFGGLLHLTGAIENNYIGMPSYGMPIALLGLLLSAIGLLPRRSSSITNE